MFFNNIICITLFISNEVAWQETVKRIRQSILEKAEKLKNDNCIITVNAV